MIKTTIGHFAKRASVPTASMLLALLVFTSPVSATTALGAWWTNHSTCKTSSGLITVDTQGRYFNKDTSGGPQHRMTQFIGTAVSSGYSNVKLTRYKWTMMVYNTSGGAYVWDSYDLNLGTGIPVPTGEFVPAKVSSYAYQNQRPFVKYQAWLSNGAYCQGQWNIGQ